MPGKVEAIISASEPQELRSLLNYYGKFVPNLLIIVHPLNSLLQHAKKWKWSPACSYAFTEAKQVLSSASVLVQYDPTTSHTSCRHICLLNCSCDLTQTSRRHREPSLPTPSQQVNRIMHRLRRKRSPSSLELKNSINTFMARSFFSSLTTNQFWQFSGQRKAFHHWQLLDYSVRKFCSLHTNIKFSSNLQRHMPMQMVCHDYHCHTNQIWLSYHTRPHLLSTFSTHQTCAVSDIRVHSPNRLVRSPITVCTHRTDLCGHQSPCALTEQTCAVSDHRVHSPNRLVRSPITVCTHRTDLYGQWSPCTLTVCMMMPVHRCLLRWMCSVQRGQLTIVTFKVLASTRLSNCRVQMRSLIAGIAHQR